MKLLVDNSYFHGCLLTDRNHLICVRDKSARGHAQRVSMTIVYQHNRPASFYLLILLSNTLYGNLMMYHVCYIFRMKYVITVGDPAAFLSYNRRCRSSDELLLPLATR